MPADLARPHADSSWPNLTIRVTKVDRLVPLWECCTIGEPKLIIRPRRNHRPRRELLVLVLKLIQLVINPAMAEQLLMTPISRSCPLCITMILSARCIVESRCAMITEVRPSTMRLSASRTRNSVSVSTLEVASSRIRIFGLCASARANEISCFCPVESVLRVHALPL